MKVLPNWYSARGVITTTQANEVFDCIMTNKPLPTLDFKQYGKPVGKGIDPGMDVFSCVDLFDEEEKEIC